MLRAASPPPQADILFDARLIRGMDASEQKLCHDRVPFVVHRQWSFEFARCPQKATAVWHHAIAMAAATCDRPSVINASPPIIAPRVGLSGVNRWEIFGSDGLG